MSAAVQDKRVDVRSILTRSALVSSINSMNLLALVPPEVRSAYELLTSEFNPLELCKKLDPLLASLEMRVDHRNGTLHFGSQQLESDKVRSHLSLLAKRMAKAAAMTDLHCSAQ
ncbi:hypothetical protein OEZ86_003087 [Tetradesmus obliquus]|nr:hypothetical protein OEZ86_003087 [Tetradesmus obliquus]